MKNYKTNIALVAACTTIVALFLSNQRAESQSAPPPAPHAFNAHFTELNASLIDGASTATYTLPVLNRAVQVSVSCVRNDGADYMFDVPVCFYATGRGEFNVKGAGAINNPDSYPDGLGLGGVTLFGGTNGTFYFRNDFGAPVTLHVALRY